MRVPAYLDRPDATAGDGRYSAGADLLRALGSPARLAIVDELSRGDRCVHELMAACNLPQTQVSQHLRVLKDARVVRGRRRGREVIYALSDPEAAAIVHAALARSQDHR
jgi:DNA-binding transcriptional ArsR family regulator